MSADTQRIFRLLETADNFVKYAPSGREGRAAERARRRYERAVKLAERAGDEELVEQARIRIADLDRRAEMGAGVVDDSIDDRDPGTVVTAELPDHAAARVPPGQRVTRGWPVLHEGPIPRFDPQTWSLRVFGACENELELGYEELKTLPNVDMRSDFHCVTGWSKLDNTWTGVQTKILLERARPRPDASHVTMHAEHGYTANVPLAALLRDDAMVAWAHNGEPLAPKHGFPLRVVIPKLYGWKSVKWVRAFELMASDRRGFWELRGYHNRADPWLEERYSYQER